MNRRAFGTDWASMPYILASQGRGWAWLGLLWAALTGLQLLLVRARDKCVQGGTRRDCKRTRVETDRPSNSNHQLIGAMDCAGPYATRTCRNLDWEYLKISSRISPFETPDSES